VSESDPAAAGPPSGEAAAVRLSVVLPVYNEAGTVAVIIDKVLELKLPDVDIELIIVESNSTDGSREVVARYANHPRVRLIYEDHPSGKGHAVRVGFGAVTGDIVLIQDADLEYRVVLGPLLDGTAEFVLGCRHAPGQPMRHFEGAQRTSRVMNAAHWGFTAMFNTVYGTKLRDPFTMYKVFRTTCIVGMPFESNRFDFDWELVAKLVRRGYRPLEIPITYESRSFESGKKVRFFRDPLTWMVALVKFRFSDLTAPGGDLRVALPQAPVHPGGSTAVTPLPPG
jgi:glycosyltransferase involved in cell wall biosynthesis